MSVELTLDRLLRLTIAVAGCAVVAGTAGAGYAYLETREHKPLLEWGNPAVVERGRALYAAQCAGCHGAKGEGQVATGGTQSKPLAPAHDASGHTWQHPDFALVQLTKAGTSTVACRTLDANAMPRFGRTLSDRDILDVLSYIKSTWPPDVVAQQEKVNRLYDSHNDIMRSMLKLQP
jgi:S-disulfanyl-L-cysteine oxidoreductase SoxD